MKPDTPTLAALPKPAPKSEGFNITMTEEEALVLLKLLDTVPATGREIMKRFISLGAKVEAAQGDKNVR